MAQWIEDLQTCTREEILGWQCQNREWSKELRRKANELVNSRLNNEISFTEYVEKRKLAHEEAQECRRRAAILEAH